jgi:hypothetical protein
MDTTVENLLERYKVACNFDRPVDREAVERHLLNWWSDISKIPMRVEFVDTAQEIKRAARAAGAAGAARTAWDDAWAARTARDARAAWADAWAARTAWDAWTAGAAGAARTAWDAWDAWTARAAWADAWADAWTARAASTWCIIAIGARERDDDNLFSRWYPLFQAFEAGLWLFFVCEDKMVVLTLPTIHRDEDNRLHKLTGPAFTYGDVNEYYVHGVNVPADIIEEPSSITAARIDAEQNVEVRRIMIDMFTPERYIVESGAQKVHEDTYGILWRKSVPGDEDIVMVEVVNSTPEPDGTHKHYWLRVDPSQYHGDAGKYAQAAVASTVRDIHGNLIFLDWRDYAPIFES